MDKKIKELVEQIRQLEQNPEDALALPCNTYYLDNDLILCGVRNKGVSRYPYSYDGLDVWASHNGYVTACESNFTIFRPSYTDEVPCMGFFMGIQQDDGSYYPISVSEANSHLFEPKDLKRYTVYSPSAVYYIADTEKYTFAVRIFVSTDKKINFTMCAVNNTNEPTNIYLASAFEALLRFEEREDFWSKNARDTRLLPNGNFIFHTTHAKENYMALNTRISGSEPTKCYYTTSLGDFVGTSGRTLSNARSLVTGMFERCEKVTKRVEMPIAGGIFHFSLSNGGSASIDYSCTVLRDEAEALKLANDTSVPSANFGELISAYEKKAREDIASLQIHFADWNVSKNNPEVLNRFLRSVQRQVSCCAFGKTYTGPWLGVRDVFQQLEGALIWNPNTSREKIITALNFIDPSGRPPRQFAIPPSKDINPSIDARPFIDQGLWIIDTVYTYLCYTDDYSILDVECGYCILPENGFAPGKYCERRDSVLDHLILIAEYLISNLDTEYKTDCLRILFGDWNDAIDGLGACIDGRQRFGSGVSVMATLQLYRCLWRLAEILKHINKHVDLIPKFTECRERIFKGFFKYAVQTNEKNEKRIVHGWGDKISYYVGSFEDTDGANRISFASNAFYALSDMIREDDSLKETAISALKSLDSRFGLKTLAPYFPKEMKGVGRIANTLPGTAENECAYVHASMFSICALFAMGESEYAWKQFDKSIVISREAPSLTTFAMPNSYFDNETYNLNGESAGDWHTGSGTVLMKGLVKYGLGINPQLDGLIVELPSFMPTDSLDASVLVKGNQVRIRYRNSKVGNRKYTVNGQPVKTSVNPVSNNLYIYIDKGDLKDLCVEVTD